ncbi:nucleotidyltransferase family protein [uncultured Jannaschia sp.]|uniref:nucleotidyltransferase family protein n=1 Tax=uncultured Jannaschia sp. TaxID=293347 RepID=UPI00262CBFDC|nr:nucleotidyltransferase family protein [uncultured Jannaschia sp.]
MIGAMVFAAGLGTRMRPLTDDRPKGLVEVAGRALVDHALEQVAGARPVVVNAHHHADKLIDHLASQDVTVLHETPRLLDTGGGLRNALPYLGTGPVFTMNADAVWTGPTAFATLAAAWAPERMDGLLLLVPLSRAVGPVRGSFRMRTDGSLLRDPDGHAYTGAGLMKTDELADAPREVFSLRDLWFDMAARGRLHGVLHRGRWADVGTPDGIAAAEAMLAAQV